MATGTGNPFSRANLPFTLVIVASVAVLASFLLVVEPFAGDVDLAAPTTSQPAPTTTGLPGDADTTTTLAGEDIEPCSGTAPPIPDDLDPLQGIRLELVTTDVDFPTYATALPGDDRIFVLERAGRIRMVAPDGRVSTFLDLTDRVDESGIENGLLGMAFHPDYADNGRIFIYYTTGPSDSPDSRLSEFRATGRGASSVDRATETVLLHVPQQGIRNRGGMVTFGYDGYLYLSLGDGGIGDRSAQDLTTYQGSILRIDVDGTDGDRPYAVPADNPFVGRADALDEIWAYGLRNPWRFTIDLVDCLIYIADVGEADWEEINVQPAEAAGLDYGWPTFQGTACFRPVDDDCDVDPEVIPVLTISHREDDRGCAVTGGFVYRGRAIPELWGHYFYGDWCFGWMSSFRYVDGELIDHRDWTGDLQASFAEIPDLDRIHLGSFGLDGDGELLVVDTNGAVFRVVPRR